MEKDRDRRPQEGLPTVEALIDLDDSGIRVLRSLASHPGANANVILTRDDDVARRTLLDLGVTTRSLPGTMVFDTGGIAIGNGLIRLFGSGGDRALLVN